MCNTVVVSNNEQYTCPQLYAMYLGVELNLAYALMTLFTASRKSFSVAT